MHPSPFPDSLSHCRDAMPGPVLGIDTSAGTAVAVVGAVPTTLLIRPGTRNQVEQLAPTVHEVLEQAQLAPGELAAIAVGTGPAPYTGLRIGLMTAMAMGRALGIPVWGVCSLDVLAWDAAVGQPREASRFVCVLDARRKEVYVEVAQLGPNGLEVVQPPAVCSPTQALKLAEPAGSCVVGRRDLLGLDGHVADVNPELLVLLAAHRAASGLDTAPRPLYLRRPDVMPPAPRKRATV